MGASACAAEVEGSDWFVGTSSVDLLFCGLVSEDLFEDFFLVSVGCQIEQNMHSIN